MILISKIFYQFLYFLEKHDIHKEKILKSIYLKNFKIVGVEKKMIEALLLIELEISKINSNKFIQ